MPSTEAPGYSTPARALHWLVAAGIVLQYLLGERAEDAADTGQLLLQLASLAQHKSVGISILGLAVLRVVWRALHKPPQLPHSYRASNPLLARLSALAHFALYALLFFLPVSGWLMSSASAYSVSWFGVITLPDLIGPSDTAKEWLRSAHHLAAKALFVLALIHIAAAFKHWLIDKNDVMGRMASTATVTLFAVTVAGGVWATWPSTNDTAAEQPPPAAAEVKPPVPPVEEVRQQATDLAQPNLPALWQLDSEHSYITFTAVQAGAEFIGEWQSFDAQIRFDPAQLDLSTAEVRIDAASVATRDSERDTTLAGSDWFDSLNFAEVTFTAGAFEQRSDGSYSTQATLGIRGKNYPVQFDFTVTNSASQRTLRGQSKLDRLALNLGTLEWTDTDWVGQFVDVDVVVTAQIGAQTTTIHPAQ